MDSITHSQVRMRLAKIAKPIFNATFKEIYATNVKSFQERKVDIIDPELRAETLDFTEKVVKCTSSSARIALYKSVEPDVITTFYLRYSAVIDTFRLADSESRMGVPEEPAMFLKFLMFALIENDTSKEQNITSF